MNGNSETSGSNKEKMIFAKSKTGYMMTLALKIRVFSSNS